MQYYHSAGLNLECPKLTFSGLWTYYARHRLLKHHRLNLDCSNCCQKVGKQPSVWLRKMHSCLLATATFTMSPALARFIVGLSS